SSGEQYYFSGCTSVSQCVFPNAQIPRSAWSAPALALLQNIPQANQGATIFSSSSENESLRDDKGAIRMDVATRWGSLSGYYFADDYHLDNPYPTGQGGANVPGFNAISQGRAQLLSLGFTKIRSEEHTSELQSHHDLVCRL